MGFMDKMKEMVSGHKDQASGAIDKAGDVADDKTGGKYADKVDTAQEKAKDALGGDEPKA
jgi:MT0933-like antitoxin protein